MSIEFDGTASYIEATSSVVTAVPCTLACWFNLDNATANHTLLSVSASGATNARFALLAAGGAAGDPIRAAAQAGGTVAQANAGTFLASTWHHGCAVFSTNSNRIVYFDGTTSGNNTTAVTPSSAAFNRTDVGTQWVDQARGNYADGKIAEAAIWNVALTSAEIISLSLGLKPSLVRPQSLVFYSPLIREVIDYARSLSLTTNSTTVADHSRRIG